MSYRTVNLSPRTYARLRHYKIGGASFDEVISALLDRVPPRELYQEALRSYEKEQPVGRRPSGRGGRSLARALREEFHRSWPRARNK